MHLCVNSPCPITDMNLCLNDVDPFERHFIDCKSSDSNGLILFRLHYVRNERIRFLYTSFHAAENIVALATHAGNICLLDFSANIYWALPDGTTTSCCCLQFSTFRTDDILIGTVDGVIHMVSIDSGQRRPPLRGHKFPVTRITFSTQQHLCLTHSKCEAFIWDLNTNIRLQVLNLNGGVGLKLMLFMPVSNHILGCFSDDSIHIWRFGSFHLIHQINALQLNGIHVKSITFTKNGSTMVICGSGGKLAVCYVNSAFLIRTIELPQTLVRSVKCVEFVSQPNDGGCNNILSILSGNGTIFLYDFGKNIILNDLTADSEIIRYCQSHKGHYLAAVLRSGDVLIYNILHCIQHQLSADNVNHQGALPKNPSKKCNLRTQAVRDSAATSNQIKKLLAFEKLKLILKEYGEYPEKYRTNIWEQLLRLPSNSEEYNAMVNHEIIESFSMLDERYPLEDKRLMKNLKKLLSNLVVWCPFLTHVNYLPEFVFPFVKVFQHKPFVCFEAVCTIIVNWCQMWFEDFPLPPHNVLSLIENILNQHDGTLLNHFVSCNIPAQLYAWPLLQTAFTQVLISSEWLIFWDHVLTNEPGFLLCACAAFNSLKRTALLAITVPKKLEEFYRIENVVHVKALLRKTYHFLEHTDASTHPRRYLKMFRSIDTGRYPVLVDYPRERIDEYSAAINDLRQQFEHIRTDELDVLKQHVYNVSKAHHQILKRPSYAEGGARTDKMIQDALNASITTGKDQILQYQKSLCQLQKALIEEHQLVGIKLSEHQARDSVSSSDFSSANTHTEHESEDAFENVLLTHYANLLKHKFAIQELTPFNHDADDESQSTKQMQVLLRQQSMLADDLKRLKSIEKNAHEISLLSISTGIEILTDLIERIEKELSHDMKSIVGNEQLTSDKMLKLQTEGAEVLNELNAIMQLHKMHS